MFKSVLLAFLFCSSLVSAQLDDYKYIIVPKKFAAFKESNKYQSSTMIKFYMEKAGFNVIYDDNLPDDLSKNRCLGLLTDIQDNSNMLTPKLAILLKDCKGRTVYTTPEYKTKEKDVVKAYKELLTKTSGSFMGVSNNYVEKPSANTTNGQEKGQIQNTTTQLTPVKAVDNGLGEVEVSPDVEEQPTINDDSSGAKTLSAIATKQGYLLVDQDDTILYRLTATAADNVFLADKKGRKGIVYKKEGKWFFESEKESNKTVTELNIQF